MATKKTDSKTAAQHNFSNEHLIFIDAVIKGATRTEAYLLAYPTSSRQAANSSSSRLMQKAEIWQRIIDGQEAIRLRRQQQARQDIVDELTRIDARLFTLQQIIDNDFVGKDTCINKDTGAVTERYKQDPKAVISAIKLEMRLIEQRNLLKEELLRFDEVLEAKAEDLSYLSVEEIKERVEYLEGRPFTYHDPVPQLQGNKITSNNLAKLSKANNKTSPGV